MRISVKDTPVGTPEPDIIVTVAGKEHVVWRALIRQAIPMLTNPEGYSTFQRRQLAQSLTFALEIDGECGDLDHYVYTDQDVPPEPEDSGFEAGIPPDAPWD